MITEPQRHKEGTKNTKDSGISEEIEQLARRVIGCAIEVHKVLGPRFLESVYEEALSVELRMHGIPFVRQPLVDVGYKGHHVGAHRLDLLVGEVLVVELKAVEAIDPIYIAQVLSYLKATGNRLGLLINFNVSVLKQGIRRIIL